ncbi:MAG TPA: NADH:flavin oxidoreductase [Bacteriovoracaceae bacterium]|nr:NADH:flavin oxidoreductase [Bacteriovoracaceae bacterium]
MKTLDRHTTLPLRNHKTLANRVVLPPMASETADEQGLVTPATLDHYTRLATSRAGLLMVEYSFVHRSGRSEGKQLGIDGVENLPGLTQLAQVLKAHGSLAGIQLTHAGGKTERILTQGELQAPSSVAVPVNGKTLEAPTPMTQAHIDLWVESFIQAAGLAAAAGFDLVEIHAAHGYGINQWLSPLTNRRTDRYGGSIDTNMTVLLEILRGIRQKHPGLLLAVRIPGQDFYPGGLSREDCVFIARTLESAGVDIIDVSSGIGGWRRPGARTGEGYLIEEAAHIQQQLGIPVIGVGGIKTGEYVDQIVASGSVSLAAIGRAFLAEPTFLLG